MEYRKWTTISTNLFIAFTCLLAFWCCLNKWSKIAPYSSWILCISLMCSATFSLSLSSWLSLSLSLSPSPSQSTPQLDADVRPSLGQLGSVTPITLDFRQLWSSEVSHSYIQHLLPFKKREQRKGKDRLRGEKWEPLKISNLLWNDLKAETQRERRQTD